MTPIEDKSYKIHKDVLKDKFSKLTGNEFNLNLLTENKEAENISTQDLYTFINYNESDDFDPVEEAYYMFLNEEQNFDIVKYN